MSMRRILIAVDEQPVSVRAAEVGSELARSLGGEVALIHVHNGSADYAMDTGLAPQELAARAEQEGRRLLAGLMAVLTVIGWFHYRRTPDDQEFPKHHEKEPEKELATV